MASNFRMPVTQRPGAACSFITLNTAERWTSRDLCDEVGNLGRMDALRRFQKDWLLGVSSIAEMKETLRRPIRPYMSFLPWPAVEQEHNSHALRAYRLDPPMRPRAMTLVYRLHTGRQAIGDFIRAAAKLQGPRNFDPTVRGRNSQ